MKILNKHKGMTLAEMMIAMALGMLVVYFIINIMVSSSRSAQQSEGLSQAQENGRFILSWLHNNVRKAGYIPGVILERSQPFADRCSAGSPVPPAAGGDCSFESNTDSDRLAVRRAFIEDSPDSPSNYSDCTGVDLRGSVADGEMLTDVYWVERNIDPDAAGDAYDDVLRCVTYDSTGNTVSPAQTIASGIESLQVLYGSRPELNNQNRTNVNRYTAINEIVPLDWTNVRSVRIAVLTRSFSDTTLTRARRSYIVLDSDPLTFNDSVARHIQSTTVYLPNE